MLLCIDSHHEEPSNRICEQLLLGMAPFGPITFVSPVFEGAITDRCLVQKSGFLEKLQPGDAVLADRGFDIRDEMNLAQV